MESRINQSTPSPRIRGKRSGTRRAMQICLAAAAVFCVAAGARFSGKVVRISSGDRLTVLHELNPEVIVVYGVACPLREQPFALEAEQFLTGVAAGQTVTIQVRDYDIYNRTVAEVTLPDGRNLGPELLRRGLAWWDQINYPDDQELKQMEAEARAARRGIWLDPNPVPPWEWHNAVYVPLVSVSSPSPDKAAAPPPPESPPVKTGRPENQSLPRAKTAPREVSPRKETAPGPERRPRPSRRQP